MESSKNKKHDDYEFNYEAEMAYHRIRRCFQDFGSGIEKIKLKMQEMEDKSLDTEPRNTIVNNKPDKK